jgi:hypothetical protein
MRRPRGPGGRFLTKEELLQREKDKANGTNVLEEQLEAEKAAKQLAKEQKAALKAAQAQ